MDRNLSRYVVDPRSVAADRWAGREHGHRRVRADAQLCGGAESQHAVPVRQVPSIPTDNKDL